jgi:hypothetical protein
MPPESPRTAYVSRPVRPSDAAVVPARYLERQHPRPHEVRSMDPLVALRDHEPHPEQRGPLRRPIAAGSAAVFLAGEERERDSLVAVPLGRVEDREHLAARQVRGPRTLGPGCELVAEPDVREGAPHHHLVVPAAGPVRIELGGGHTVLLEISARRRIRLDRARR